MNLSGLFLVAGLAANSPSAPGSIHGVVRSAETGVMLYLAEVHLVAKPPIRLQRTDSTVVDGEFRFDDIPPGASPKSWNSRLRVGR